MLRATWPQAGCVRDRSTPPDLKDFGARLRKARSEEESSEAVPRQPGAMGLAFRLATEMAAALFVGGVLGWVVDSRFGTRPWGLLALLALGAVAGTVAAFREARRLSPPEG